MGAPRPHIAVSAVPGISFLLDQKDKESKRVKFVLITWIGDKAGIMRKAKVCVDSIVKAVQSEVNSRTLRYLSILVT